MHTHNTYFSYVREKSRGTATKFSPLCFPVHLEVFFLVLRDRLHLSSGFAKIIHINQYWNLAENILLFLDAQSTYEETSIVVVLSNWHEVEFVVIVPLVNSRQQNTAKRLLFTFQSQNTYH